MNINEIHRKVPIGRFLTSNIETSKTLMSTLEELYAAADTIPQVITHKDLDGPWNRVKWPVCGLNQDIALNYVIVKGKGITFDAPRILGQIVHSTQRLINERIAYFGKAKPRSMRAHSDSIMRYLDKVDGFLHGYGYNNTYCNFNAIDDLCALSKANVNADTFNFLLERIIAKHQLP